MVRACDVAFVPRVMLVHFPNIGWTSDSVQKVGSGEARRLLREAGGHLTMPISALIGAGNPFAWLSRFEFAQWFSDTAVHS